MVADLTRQRACTVEPGAQDKPKRANASPVPKKPDPKGDEPMRLFVWASA